VRFSLITLLGSLIGLLLASCNSEPALVPQTWMAAGHDFASDLSVDATHVYFAESRLTSSSAMFRLSKKEGALPEAIVLEEKEIASPVIDDAYVYWVGSDPRSIRAAPKAGGALPREIIADPVAFELGIAVDEQHIYARRWKGPIVRVSKGGGEARVVVDPGGTVAAVDEGHVYFFTEQAILKAPKVERGAAVTLAAGQRPQDLVIAGRRRHREAPPVTRGLVARFLPCIASLASLLVACGDREVPDAEWRFEWSVAGRTVVDVWTDRGSTCGQSESSDENILALLYKSKLAACQKECKPKPRQEVLACRLACDKEIKITARKCTQRTREVKPPPLFPVH
jgi:hypothetical protein